MDLQRFQTAADVYRGKAEAGDVSAALKLAALHEQGKLGSRNYIQAMHWYKMAAYQGDVNAMYQVASIYEFGQGKVQLSPDQAVEWYGRAAQRGHVYSLYRLAAVHAAHASLDDVEGYTWLMISRRLARKCASDDALCGIARRDAFSTGWLLEKRLSEKQVRRARLKAQKWRPS